MNTQPSPLLPISNAPAAGRATHASTSAAGAISWGLDDTLRLLFRPFDAWRWTKLSLLCLFLGGGTPTAAFQWSLTALPSDFRMTDLVAGVRQYIAEHPSLIFLVIVFAIALGLGFLYLRSIFRFILVDSLVKMEVALSSAWSVLRPLGQSYFWWLAATLVGLATAFLVMVIVSFSGLQAASTSGSGKLFATASLALILSLIVLLGLVVALLIMLTDDLVVPLMYAERLPLPSAWRQLWQKMRQDPASFAVYILLRFLLSVGVSVAVLLFLVPLLVGVFSSAIILAATAVMTLHLLGHAWVWNLPTISLAATALALLGALLVILLSVVGMPGQVFLQGFGLRFIAARSPSLKNLCSVSGGRGRLE
ncbi:MAG: hypothetical protein ACLQVM_01255 [Terriglobia bacterium]